MVTIRDLAALGLAALIASLGALFLGEYEFDEALPVGAGALLGLVMGEVVVSVARRRTRVHAGLVAAMAGVAVVLAGHLDAQGLNPVRIGAYASAVLGAAAAYIRTAPPIRSRPGA